MAVTELRTDPALREVRTTSFAGLVRIAEQSERMILHLEHEGRHTYVVEDADVRYLYGDADAAPEARRTAGRGRHAPTRGEASGVTLRRRLLLPLALLLTALMAGGWLGHAATAGNTVPAGLAGQGSQAASPYTISNVAYALDVNDPRNVAQVTFTVSPSNPRVVKARLFDAGSWYACTNIAGSVTCATTSPAAAATSANHLTVVAAQ